MLRQDIYHEEIVEGLTFVHERKKHLFSTVVNFTFHFGSRHEKKEHIGATHFAEHLYFKGTTTQSATDLAEAIEQTGGDVNAFTDRELTSFHCHVPSDSIDLAFKTLFQMLYDHTYSKEDFELEKNVVLSEIKSYLDSPDDEFQDLVWEIPWGEHGLGRRITGFEKNVEKLKYEAMQNFMSEVFLKAPLVISVVSPYTHQQIKKKLLKHMTQSKDLLLGDALLKKRKKIKVTRPQYKNFNKYHQFKTDQLHWAFHYPTCSAVHKNAMTWSALGAFMGMGSFSEFYRELREQEGLAYYVSVANHFFSDCGVLQGYVSCSANELEQVIRQSRNIVDSLEHRLTQDKVDQIKEMYAGIIKMNTEGSFSRSETLAKHIVFYNQVINLDELIQELDNITLKSLRKAAGELSKNKLSSFLFGPVKRFHKNKVLKLF